MIGLWPFIWCLPAIIVIAHSSWATAEIRRTADVLHG